MLQSLVLSTRDTASKSAARSAPITPRSISGAEKAGVPTCVIVASSRRSVLAHHRQVELDMHSISRLENKILEELGARDGAIAVGVKLVEQPQRVARRGT